ncbi:hypothetical protein AB0M02_39360 [Actinoplanes sp. NPDC051861]|uniref:hypothetical protein n=1 Tax=Actinoplanes sp. NPDC051861 TaxID=3155170 RepID=UPI0034434FB3
MTAVMVVATVAFCLGGLLFGGAFIFLALSLSDLRALGTLRRTTPTPIGARSRGRVALEGVTEYGPAGRQFAPVSGEDCAWYHVVLLREPSRRFSRGDDPDHDVLLDVASPAWPTLADHGGRLPVDPRTWTDPILEEPSVPVTTRLEHRLAAPVPLPSIVPPDVVADLRKSERLSLTEVRIPRGTKVFALARVNGRGLAPRRSGATVFTTLSRAEVLTSRRESMGMGRRMAGGFGLAGLALMALAVAYFRIFPG